MGAVITQTMKIHHRACLFPCSGYNVYIPFFFFIPNNISSYPWYAKLCSTINDQEARLIITVACICRMQHTACDVCYKTCKYLYKLLDCKQIHVLLFAFFGMGWKQLTFFKMSSTDTHTSLSLSTTSIWINHIDDTEQTYILFFKKVHQ